MVVATYSLGTELKIQDDSPLTRTQDVCNT